MDFATTYSVERSQGNRYFAREQKFALEGRAGKLRKKNAEQNRKRTGTLCKCVHLCGEKGFAT